VPLAIGLAWGNDGGDWAVYRTGKIALLIEHSKLTNVNILNIMRPKFPRFQT
jgi:hypothetical protein